MNFSWFSIRKKKVSAAYSVFFCVEGHACTCTYAAYVSLFCVKLTQKKEQKGVVVVVSRVKVFWSLYINENENEKLFT